MGKDLSRRGFLEGLGLGIVAGTALPLFGDVATGASLEQPDRQAYVVDNLLPDQSESGLVTQKELDLAEKWLTAATDTNDGKPEWVDEWLGTALPFSFQYRGKPSAELLKTWHLQIGERKVGPETIEQELTWDEAETGLRVIWQMKRFVNYPAIDWLLYFENRGSADTPILEDIQALDLRMKHSQKVQPYTVHGALGGRQLPDDLMPFSHLVPDPQFAIAKGAPEGAVGLVDDEGDWLTGELVLDGAPDNHSHLPFFNLETPERRGVLVGVGWSGEWMARVDVKGQGLWARTGMKKTHFVLRPGERVRSPRVLLLPWEGKRLHGHNMLRQLLYKCYVPRLEGKLCEPLVTFNTTEVCTPYATWPNAFSIYGINEKALTPLVKPLTQLGLELFIHDGPWNEGTEVDWHNGLGNHRISRAKFPHGFRCLSEPLAAANVGFGLYFAPELVNPNAPVVREHPNWIGDGRYLLMELPEVREWFLKFIDDYVQNEGMTCFREDLAVVFRDDPEDRQGIAESLHYAGFYELLDTIRARHPNLVIDASGLFTNLDLEAISRIHWGQSSDRWFNTDADQSTLYGANLYMPGGRLIMFTRATDDYGTWSSFAGQFSIAWNPAQDADFPVEQARRQVERYKRIRPYLSGDFYPLTPCSLDEAWIGYQFHRFDLDQGFCLLFRRRDSNETVFTSGESFTVRMRGLKPGNYRVRFEGKDRDETMSSQMLARGTEVVLPTAPAAEMMIYERIG